MTDTPGSTPESNGNKVTVKGPRRMDSKVDSYKTKDGERVDVYTADAGENPFELADTVGKIAADEGSSLFCFENRSKDPYKAAVDAGAILTIPLATFGGHHTLDRDPDSKKTHDAVIYTTPGMVRNIYGDDGATIEQIIDALKIEISEYSKWENGEKLVADIYDKNGDYQETSSGFDSMEDIKKEWKQ